MRYRGRFARGFFGSKVAVPKGYRYIGHCRCGFGPNAFYVDDKGRISHMWDLFFAGEPTKEDLKEELEILKKEKEEIEKEIEELEKKVNS